MRRSLFISLSLIFTLMLGALAPAQGNPESLDQEQLKQLQASERKNAPELQRISQSIKQKKLDLVKSVRSKNFSETKVRKIVNEIIELERKKQHIYVNSMVECREILSEDQWNNFQETLIRKMLKTK